MLQDKYIGLILAMSSSVFIGLSFIITKKGLMNAKRRHGEISLHCLSPFRVDALTLCCYNPGVSAADGNHHYLRNWTWWAGMGTSK